ncbi:Molecular chaperone (DnaJ superfamily) [Ceraceosorus bombacis]|uniref:Molecular chaperone (DnaJ superfamily) n=1 Tax=Ceraceosorus bombacis TaxID=401625 RepID=A0A0P1BS32_9BASI|nr:Molecular chaperone (DnaJ superfamily) [Ceraceosorus bombacis]
MTSLHTSARSAHHVCLWCAISPSVTSIASSSQLTLERNPSKSNGFIRAQSSLTRVSARVRLAASLPARPDHSFAASQRGAHTASALEDGLSEDDDTTGDAEERSGFARRSMKRHAGHPRHAHSQIAGSEDSSLSELAFPTSSNFTPYDVFHLPKTASSLDIKARYYDLVRLYHPDKQAANHVEGAPLAAEMERQRRQEWEVMQQAYDLLKHDHRRRRYDAAGIGWTAGIGSAVRGSTSPWHGPPSARKGWEFRGSGHDGFGWQSYAKAQGSSHDFYGSNPAPDPKSGPRYMPNAHFFLAVGGLTWSLAAVQYVRLANESKERNVQLEQKSALAAQSLERARQLAKSKEGKSRLDSLRKRAREQQLLVMDEENVCSSESAVSVLPAPSRTY